MRITGGRAGRARRVVALGALALGALAWGPPPAGGQVAPTITVLPVAPGPDDPIDLTIAGCTDEPFLFGHVQFDDVVGALDVDLTDLGGGAWAGTIGPYPRDLDLTASCTEGRVDVTIDVDDPVLLPAPFGGDWASGVLGTDCPAGATPEAVLLLERVQVPLEPTEPDAEGDWSAELPDDLGTATTGEVRAGCGAVTYATLVVALPPVPTTSTSTTTTSTVPAAGPAATPATPVAAAATFAG